MFKKFIAGFGLGGIVAGVSLSSWRKSTEPKELVLEEGAFGIKYQKTWFYDKVTYMTNDSTNTELHLNYDMSPIVISTKTLKDNFDITKKTLESLNAVDFKSNPMMRAYHQQALDDHAMAAIMYNPNNEDCTHPPTSQVYEMSMKIKSE